MRVIRSVPAHHGNGFSAPSLRLPPSMCSGDKTKLYLDSDWLIVDRCLEDSSVFQAGGGGARGRGGGEVGGGDEFVWLISA